MLFSTHSFYALVATLILSKSLAVVHAGHVRLHRHHLRMHQDLHPRIPDHGHTVHNKAVLLTRDTTSTNTTGTSQILSDTTAFAEWIDAWAASTNTSNSASSIAQVQGKVKDYEGKMQTWLQANSASSTSTVQQIQSYFTTFSQWMDNWMVQANSTDPVAAKNTLQADVQEYITWMTTLIRTSNSTGAAGPALPSATGSLSSSLATPLISSFVDAQVSISPTAGATTTTSFVTALVTSTTTKVSTLMIQGSSLLASSVASSVATSSNGGQFVQLPSYSNLDAQSSTVSTTLIISSTALPETTLAVSSPASSNSPHTSSKFNPRASDNVAVYFGQTAETGQVPLPKLCSDASIDIVLLAFLNDYFGASNDAGSTPSTNFGPFSPEQLAPQVTECQQQGKIVLLSLGGAKEYSKSTFTDDAEATTFAHTLWDSFGGGTADPSSRPFGSIKFDGFDIDNESGNQIGYQAFASTLQSLYKTDTSKKYYLSSAPQCPIPDLSIPLPSMQNMDFVWVQFFNNGNCNIGQSDFIQSIQAWSKQLKGGSTEGPMVMLGAPASTASAGSGYLEPVEMQKALQGVKDASLTNFGGVMLWDGSQAVANGNYHQMVKQALA